MAAHSKKTQTVVKHTILETYLDAWHAIILNGLKRRSLKPNPTLIYVDGFGFAGRYGSVETSLSETSRLNLSHWGSPIIGLNALARARAFATSRGMSVNTLAILIEKDPDNFKELIKSVRDAGFTSNLMVNPDRLEVSSSGTVALQGDFNQYNESIVQRLGADLTWSLVFIDPYGPKAMPWSSVSRIVALPRTDVLINFPYNDVNRKSGYEWGPEITPENRMKLHNLDALYGDTRWRSFMRDGDGLPSEPLATERVAGEWYADEYLAGLQRIDQSLTVKHLRLRFEERNASVYYLFLTTRDPSGALALNKILWDAKLQETALRWNAEQKRWHERNVVERGQTTLFDVSEYAQAPSAPSEPSLDMERFTRDLHVAFRNRSVERRDVLRYAAKGDVFEKHVNRALKALRAEGLCGFEEPLRARTIITFISKNQDVAS